MFSTRMALGSLTTTRPLVVPRVRRGMTVMAVTAVMAVYLVLAASLASSLLAAEGRQDNDAPGESNAAVCRVLADKRLEEPIRAIAGEYGRRSGSQVSLKFLAAAEVEGLVEKNEAGCDVVVCMAAAKEAKTPTSLLFGARKVAWKYPSGEPVWAAAVGKHPRAADLLRFLGGPTGHRLWSESKAGFTITSGRTHAEAFEWVVEHRLKHTYPATAVRMLRECGGIQDQRIGRILEGVLRIRISDIESRCVDERGRQSQRIAKAGEVEVGIRLPGEPDAHRHERDPDDERVRAWLKAVGEGDRQRVRSRRHRIPQKVVAVVVGAQGRKCPDQSRPGSELDLRLFFCP